MLKKSKKRDIQPSPGSVEAEPKDKTLGEVVEVKLAKESIDALAEAVTSRLIPVVFVAARAASYDSVHTTTIDAHALLKNIAKEAKVAMGFYYDFVNE